MTLPSSSPTTLYSTIRKWPNGETFADHTHIFMSYWTFPPAYRYTLHRTAVTGQRLWKHMTERPTNWLQVTNMQQPPTNRPRGGQSRYAGENWNGIVENHCRVQSRYLGLHKSTHLPRLLLFMAVLHAASPMSVGRSVKQRSMLFYLWCMCESC